jgi:hypothetical protein
MSGLEFLQRNSSVTVAIHQSEDEARMTPPHSITPFGIFFTIRWPDHEALQELPPT